MPGELHAAAACVGVCGLDLLCSQVHEAMQHKSSLSELEGAAA